jgi:hypothetical protein
LQSTQDLLVYISRDVHVRLHHVVDAPSTSLSCEEIIE